MSRNSLNPNKKVGLIVLFLLATLLIAVALLVPAARAANPAPVQIFYTPAKEAQLLELMQGTAGAGTPSPGSPMHAVLSMVATRDGTYIYYDHWEDGFETDIANPVQSTTLVLGDSNLSNGCAGAYFPSPLACTLASHDVIDAGDILNQQEDNIVIPRDPATVLWDGGDKVGATKTIAMTRTSWADGSDTLMADSTEVYDTVVYGTLFTFPIGENPPLFSNGIFEMTAPMVMAAEDNTTISLDYDGDGTIDASTTLNEGQAFTAPIAATVLPGGTVTADKPVQVQLMTGDIGDRYAFDGFTLFPTSVWGDSYYTPVSRTCNNTTSDTVGAEDSHVWLHNPSTTSTITINWQDASGTGSIPVSPSATEVFTTTNSIGNNPSGSHFWTTDDSPFGAIGTMDSDLNAGSSNSAWDWGYTLVPETGLSTAVIVGWGPGQDPTITPFTQNGNPIWVTPVSSTRVYADFDGDPTTGAFTDPNGDQYDAHYDLTTLQSQLIRDTVNGDNDQTGTAVYTTDGTPIAVAWGQDVCVASPGAPGLDVGTTVLPLATLDLTKESSLAVDVNGNGLVDAGDTLAYTLTIANVSNTSVSSINLEDTLDSNTSYVLSSTAKDGGSIADDGSGTPFPLDTPGYSVGSLAPGASTVFTFRVTIADPLPDGVDRVVNSAVVTSSAGTRTARQTTPVRIPAFTVSKSSVTEHTPLQPGDTITYTIDVTNDSDLIQTGVVVSDSAPAGTTYVPNSTFIKAPQQPVRATDYYVGGGDGFSGTSYDLQLDRPLVSDYFVIIQGSGTLLESGPDENYVRLTQDPFGTGDLAVSSANDVIRLERDASSSAWIGVVTVVESVSNQTTDGFTLHDVQAVAHTGTATSGTDISGTAWSSLNQVLLMGGFNGAGCSSPDPDAGDIGVCHTRLYPSGSDTINWTRDAASVKNDLSDATSTVMVVEWGSEWTVQRAVVSGTNGGDKIDELGEYDTAAISSVTRANTWVWGTGHTQQDQLKGSAEGAAIVLGNGVNQNTSETTVAVGMYDGKQKDFDVYVMTHADLRVDYRFKPDGDPDAATVDMTVDDVSDNSMALAYQGNNSGDNATPRGLFSARYTNDTTVRLETQSAGKDWASWVQSIDFVAVIAPTTDIPGGAPPTLASGYTLEPGQSMRVTFQVTVNASPGTNEIVNTADVTSDQDAGPNEASTSDPVGSVIGDRVWYDTDGDGVQDAGELGIEGVTVYLRDSGGTIIDTQVTDANGNYEFIVGTDTGNFTVDLDETTLPGGLAQSYEKDGTPYDGLVAVNIPAVGTVIDDVDYGYQPAGSISGTIYDDAGSDYNQDPGDLGLAGVELGLYYADGVTPVLDPDGNPLVVTTDADGNYSFDNLPTDDDTYVIVVDPDGDTLPALSTNYEDPDGPFDPGFGDSEAEVTLTAAAPSAEDQDFGYALDDLVTKAVDKVNADPGETLTYSIETRYTGIELLSNVHLDDIIPAGTTYVGDSDTPEATLSEPAGGGTGLLSWNLGSNVAGTDGSAPGVVLCPAFTTKTTVTTASSGDTYIEENNADDNFGDNTRLLIDSRSGELDHSLLKFDLSAIPSDAIIDSVTLGVQLQAAKDNVSTVYEMSTAWTEGDGTAGSGATWNDSDGTGGSDWATGTFGSGDYDSANSLGTIDNNQGTNTFYTISDDLGGAYGLADVVEDWVDGTGTNNGLMLLATTTATEPTGAGDAKYYSGDDGAVNAPYLVVTYRYPTGSTCTPTVRDEFAALSFSNNDGTAVWATDWVEDDYGHTGQDPNAGQITVDAGNTLLSFKTEADDPADDQNIYREVDLSGGVTAATLSLEIISNALDDTDDQIVLEIDYDGVGGTYAYAPLETFDINTTLGVKSYTLDHTKVTGQTRIRLRQNSAVNDKVLELSDVQVAWTMPPGAGGTSSLSATPHLVSDGDTVTVQLTVNSPGILNDITPTTPTVVNAVGGADCTGITGSTAAKSIGSGGGSVSWSWTCTADAGTVVPASVQFRIGTLSAKDEYGLPATFSTTTSNSVLVTPVFTYQVLVDEPVTVNPVENQATLYDSTILTNGSPSNLESTEINTALSAIGDRVWLDEDGDGEQDAGEAGIANVLVELYDDTMTLVATTYTDADGNYLFSGVEAGDYQVVVTPPAGLDPTYDEDGIGTANETDVSVTGGVVHDTADFGYNWVPAGDSTDPGTGATGAIGDTLWVDADGDGVQDPGEPGLGGVDVTIYYDPDGDGVYDTPYTGATDADGNPISTGTTTTAADGSYIFDNLPSGGYVVEVNNGVTPAGYTQTSDPDGTLDNQSDPIVLAPGDVYVNADFGYEPDAGTTGTIGDTIWLDADQNNLKGSGEPGIESVTVALIEDSNGNGVWDAGEPIIATDVTDANGNYEFSGLSVTDGAGTDDYLVWVNDASGVLTDLVPTYDADGTAPTTGVVSGLGISSVLDLTTTPVTDQDFAYAPEGHDGGEGLIGDTIFLDRDGDNTPDSGEGLEGVTVNLYASDGTTLLATAITDENGNYIFGGLATDTTYVVKVDETTLPNGGAGLTNTIDPDGAAPASESTVTLTAGSPVNLNQDFGYTADTPGTVSGTIWNDTNADGALDGGENGRYEGVTVTLLDTNGNIVATTTTAADGSYSFPNVAPGDYTVDVTDENNVLDGTWHSLGTDSETDPVSVTVNAGATTNADFGYYDEPASIGDYVWNDLNGDGIQDAGEPGLNGVEVTLTATYPNGDVTVVTTTTDENGYYSFENLLVDESFTSSTLGDPATDGVPKYEVSVASPAGTAPTLLDQGVDETVDSEDPSGETALVAQGQTEETIDFGFVEAATIGDYIWVDVDRDGLQDAGEPGIANVTVTLTGTDDNGNPVSLTTATDANGYYSFDDVPPGTYTVTVDDTTLDPGLAANQTYDRDGTLDDATTVTVTPGDEVPDADFGYAWTSDADPTGAIGDRVWIDADGDGVQDPGEAGLEGVTVELYDATGVTLLGSTTTAGDGSYMFDDLVEGNYVVKVDTGTLPAGYTQTGDPDYFDSALPVGQDDHQTTAPLTITAGYVNQNVDFGYQPPTSQDNSIGDQIYLDVDGDGAFGGSDTGIANVSVALISDTDGDGVWDAGEPIIATDLTDTNGEYLFEGLPDGDYIVVVNDTGTVLAGLENTGDPDGGFDSQSAVDLDSGGASGTGVSVLDQDYGYAPAGHDSGEGLIGDSIFLDANGNNVADPGEGLEGVRVELYDSTGTTLLAIAYSDENGNYAFGGLDPNGTYVVKVDETTLPGTGLTNTYDPDGLAPLSESTVDLSTYAGTGGVALDQDFGYQDVTDPNTIEGTLWDDVNQDGYLDATETIRFADVTMAIYEDANNNGVIDAGDTLVGTTTTDNDGNYAFTGLPDGDYLVDVTDQGDVLNGWWDSDGPDKGDGLTDNNSQDDPYAVSVTAGETHSLADFGYYLGETVSGLIFPDPLEVEGTPGTTVYLVQTWENTGSQSERGNITVYDIPDDWGLTVYRDKTNGAPAPGAYTTLPTTCPSAACLEVAVESLTDGNSILEGRLYPTAPAPTDTILNDTGGDEIPDTGNLQPAGDPNDTVTVILAVTIPSTAQPGTYVMRERGSSNNDWLAKQALDPTLPYNDDGVFHDDALKIVKVPGATVGDRVWLDEDGNGEQDAGEAGIANVEVTLTGTDAYGNVISLTTTTDANGEYLFTDVPTSDGTGYTVTVAPSAGLDPTYDKDGTLDDATTFVVTAGNEYLDADFGYNWVPSTDSTNPPTGATGAIGDRLWIDADGDGLQDPDELGLGGVDVTIYYDPDGDGVYDTPYTGATDANGDPILSGTTTTAADGSYVFDNLPADGYVIEVNGGVTPAGYTQTGDPDGTLDNQSEPIVLAPGDVVTTADFGYDPTAGSTIGDQIYLDANGDGTYDPADDDEGIPGVTVVLLDDLGSVVATATTDEDGNYSFEGVPAGDYTVWVNDTDDILGDLAQTGDPDGTLDNQHTLLGVDGTSSYLDNDFGYAPPGHTIETGLIGDTIFLDVNPGDGNDFVPGVDQPLEGVTVYLYDETGTILQATTTTDENGNYYFGGLNPGAVYTVDVDETTLPNGGTGLFSSVDPDGTDDGTTQVQVLDTALVNLDLDFGYEAVSPGVVEGTIWDDTNADGALDGAEGGRYEGVTVELLDSNGNLVATTTTAADGTYSFSGLPYGNYTVDVTDENNVLDGTWHSLGADSETDPVSVTVSATPANADFGYYSEPASLGDYVWEDLDGDGIQDAGEPGFAGVEVTLVITYPTTGGDTEVTLTTLTDENGFYSFDNLLLDESYNGDTGDGSAEPTYEISVVGPEGYTPAPIDQGGDDALDSDDPAGTPATATQGVVNDIYDFGFSAINNTDAQNDINQTPVNVPVSGDVSTNDSDDQGDNQTITSALADTDGDGLVDETLPVDGTPTDVYGTDESGAYVPAGTITLNADGSYDYVPALDFTGTVPVEYTVTDDNAIPATDSATLTIEVFGDAPDFNDPPVAQDDTNSTELGVPVSANVIIPNDSDPDGDPLTVTEVLMDTDGDGLADDPVTVGTPTPVYGTDTDGTVVPAGTLVIDSDGSYTFTPDPTFTGEVPAEYTIEDPGGLSDDATLTITIVPDAGNATFANDDANSGPQGEIQTGNILGNDTDPEGDNQDVSLIDTNGNGVPDTAPEVGTPLTIYQDGVPIGSLTVLPLTGFYIWDPEPDFVGTAVVPYTVIDENGATAEATLYLTTLPFNDTDAQNDINQTPANVPVSGDVSTNDSDHQGDNQTVTSALADTDGDGLVDETLPIGTATAVYGTDESGAYVPAGTITLNADGTYDYVPALDFTGTVPVEYTVTDDNGSPATDSATLTIEVFDDTPAVNDPPVAQDDTNSTELGVPVSANVIIPNDSDPDGDPLTVTEVLMDTDGDGLADDPVTVGATETVYGTDTDGNVVPAGTLVIDSDGSYTFTPNGSFVGEVPAEYTIEDPDGLSDDATLTIDVLSSLCGCNNTYANDDANSGPQGEIQTGNILANDNDPEGDDQDVSLIDTDGDGVPDTAPVAGVPLTISQDGTPIGELTVDPETGNYTWDPEPDFVGTAVVPYTATDNDATDDATLYLTSLAFNNTDAQNDINQTPVNLPVSGDVLTNDSDDQGDNQTVTSALADTDGDGLVDETLPIGTPTAVYGTDESGVDVPAGTITLNANGTYDYVPALDFTGTVPVEYTVTDDNGNPATDDATLTIEVFDDTPFVNDPPVAQDDTNSTEIDTPVSANVITPNDSDPDGDTLTVTEVLMDTDGDGLADDTVTVGTPTDVYGTDPEGNPVLAGELIVNSDGSYTFTPEPTFTGEVPAEYTISDGTLTDDATLTITVVPDSGNATFANDDANSAPQDVVQTGDILANDSDPEGDDQDVSLVDSDGDGVPDTAPVAGTPIDITQGGTKIGELTVDPETGAYTWDPEPDFVGTAVIPYTAVDENGATDEATLYLTSLPVNDTDAQNDINQTPVNVPVSGDVSTNDSDDQGDNQTVTSALVDTDGDGLVDETLPIGTATAVYGTDESGVDVPAGTITLNANGTYDYVPALDFTGTVPVEYTVTDVNAIPATDSATLTIEVFDDTPFVNDPPVAQDDTNATEINTPVSANVITPNDSDPDGDTLTVTEVLMDTDGNGLADNLVTVGTPTPVYGTDTEGNDVPAGTLVINSDGSYTFTPNPTFTGEVPAEYTIEDPGGLSDDATLTITIVPDAGNDTYANDDANSGPEDEIQMGNILINDSDPEGDDQDISLVDTDGDGVPDTTPVAGTPLTIYQDGTPIGDLTVYPLNGFYIWDPVADYIGTAMVPYTVIDDNGATDEATLYLMTYDAAGPDITPNITAIPNVMTGPTDYNITVKVIELNGFDTTGDIILRIPKDARWTLRAPYNPALTDLDGVPLDNADWSFDENAAEYIFTTSIVIPAYGDSTFGIEATWDAGQTQGTFTLTTQIDPWSGGEDRIDNNVDAEKLDYFIN